MDTLENIKKQIRELRAWAYLPPEKREIVNILEEAKKFLLKNQPDTELTPEGFYYRGADGKIQKVPIDFWWVRSERRLVSTREYQNRQGNINSIRQGIYETKIIVEER